MIRGQWAQLATYCQVLSRSRSTSLHHDNPLRQQQLLWHACQTHESLLCGLLGACCLLSCRAVSHGYAITALICTVLGGFGYALYGPQTQPVITASLPAMSAAALACTALTLCNPFSAFALTLEPVAVAVQTKVRMLGHSRDGDQGKQVAGDNGAKVPYVLRAVIRLGELASQAFDSKKSSELLWLLVCGPARVPPMQSIFVASTTYGCIESRKHSMYC